MYGMSSNKLINSHFNRSIMLEIFIKGGPIMWPLLICSIISLTIVIERIIFLVKEVSLRESLKAKKLIEYVKNGRISEALEMSCQSKDPIVRVLKTGIQHQGANLNSAISHAAIKELKRYNKSLSLLDTIVTMAPLLGLLGTVTGMISAFGLLGASELDAPIAITGGIAEALIATAFGLGVAILALLPFNFLNSVMEEIRYQIQDYATQLELCLSEQNIKTADAVQYRIAA